MRLAELVVDVGVGLAGFAGIIVALSGDPRTWSYAEKLRVGIMLAAVFFTVFGALFFLTLVEFLGEAQGGRVASLLYPMACILLSMFATARTIPIYRSEQETFSGRVGISAIVITFAVAIAVIVNGFFGFAPTTATLGALFV